MKDLFQGSLTVKIIGSFLVVFLLLEFVIGYVSVRRMENRLYSIKDKISSSQKNEENRRGNLITESALREMVDDYKQNIILTVLLLALTGTGLLYLVLRIWVLNPLNFIRDKHRETSLEEMEAIPEEKIPSDEIGELMLVRNGMLKKLKQEESRLRQFIYGASHDLRSPLRRIQSYAEFLREDLEEGDEESVREDLKFITESVRKMSDLLEGLLRLSRIGREEMEIGKVNMENVVDDAIENALTRDQQERITIKRDPLPDVRGDRALLTELFQNLISNAAKFTDPDEPWIKITAETKPDSVVLGVRDRGKGIPGEDPEKVFQPFETLHTEEEGRGSGMGLSICKKIVREHNGRVRATSTPGKGAHFTIEIPNDPDNLNFVEEAIEI